MTMVKWTGINIDLDIARRIDAAADRAGVPRNFLRAIVLEESGGNPFARGDAGMSVGLLQLYSFGQGAGLSIAEREDPDRNLAIGVPFIASGWRDAADVSPMRERVKVAAGLSGHPNTSEAGAPARERIAARWEALQAENPDPASTVQIGGVSMNTQGIADQANRVIAYVQEHPLEAIGIAIGAVLIATL